MPVKMLEDLILEYDQDLETIKPKKKKKKKKESSPEHVSETQAREKVSIEALAKLSDKMNLISSIIIMLGIVFIVTMFPVLVVKFILDIFLPTWIAWLLAGCTGFCCFSSLFSEIVENLKNNDD